jgi:hypothetical protein
MVRNNFCFCFKDFGPVFQHRASRRSSIPTVFITKNCFIMFYILQLSLHFMFVLKGYENTSM